jgi:hypothetical protein
MPHCNPLLYGWKFNVPWQEYIFLCLCLSILFRIAHSFVRALAIKRGDFPDAKGWNIPSSLWEAFKLCVCGFNEYKEHSDLWIPTGIGFLELVIYPVLISIGYYAVVGGWIGIKIAGGWMGYTQSRTSFNRFLLFNILGVLAASVLSLFVTPIRCL